MSIDKIELWRKGDKITANKLNDAIQAVNELIDAENTRLESTTTSSNNEGGVQFSSVSYNEQVPSWYQEITPLWNQDGETVIYDTWDGLGDVTKDAGLYGRAVGVNTLTTANYTDDADLKLVEAESAIQSGQQVVQVITVNSGGSITKNQIQIYNSAGEIPKATINPDGDSTLYRRLSRIITDPTSGSAESMPQPSAAWLYKSVATNDLTLSPITINAVKAETDTDKDKGDSEPATQAEGETESEPSAVTKQIAQMLTCSGIFAKVKGVENKGGLIFCDSPTQLRLQSGIEIYAAPASSIEGEEATISGVSKSVTPKPSKVIIAEFPIQKNLYLYDKESKEYKHTLTETEGEQPTPKLQITAQPLCGSAWRWGFTYGGKIEIDTYKYLPSEDEVEPEPEPEPTPITISGGEGITVGGNATNGFTISRNLYLAAMESTDPNNPNADNAISITCEKDGDKVTYKLYASKAASTSYEFDPDYFTVTDNSVTLKVAAIEEIAAEVASEIGVEVSVEGIVDTVKSGKIKTTTTGLSLEGDQYSANTVASLVSC